MRRCDDDFKLGRVLASSGRFLDCPGGGLRWTFSFHCTFPTQDINGAGCNESIHFFASIQPSVVLTLEYIAYVPRPSIHFLLLPMDSSSGRTTATTEECLTKQATHIDAPPHLSGGVGEYFTPSPQVGAIGPYTYKAYVNTATIINSFWWRDRELAGVWVVFPYLQPRWPCLTRHCSR